MTYIQCDIYHCWVHLKFVDYKYRQGSNDVWYRFSCCSKILPFGVFTDKDFSYLTNARNDVGITNKNDFILLKPPPNLAYLIN